MKYKLLPLDKKMGVAHLAIEGARRKPAIMKALESYQYDDIRLGEGFKMIKTIEEISVRWRAAQMAKIQATEELQAAWDEAKIPYTRTRRVARMVFNNDEPKKRALGLDGKSQRTLAKWLEEARQFYTNARIDPDVPKQLSQFGIDAKRLKQEEKRLAKVEKAMANQEQKAAEAMQITRERKEAVTGLEHYMSDYFTILRLALGKSKLLTAVGIVVK
ncbi:MAG: hypothetical protein GY950_26515 [bacterium]|nr:hypothetical protein [bacterium]